MPLNDTSEKASRVYYERLAGMTPAERVRLGVALCQAGHALQWSAVRLKYPDADEAEIAYQVAVSRFGAEMARVVYRKT